MVLWKKILAVGLYIYAVNVSATGTEPSGQPNIILIFVDDLGYGDVSMNGSPLINTPNIDAIAEEGVRLTDFHASANVCTPSRAGLMTGRYAVRAGLGKQVIFAASTHGLDGEELTLAEVLKSAGYDTAMFGKWHLGHGEGMWPTDQGFDRFFGVPYSHDMTPLPLMRDKQVVEQNVDLPTLTERLTSEAIRVIGEFSNTDTPFFIYLPYTAPHEPLLPQDDHVRSSDAGAYGDVVQELDFHIGRMMAALKDHGIDRDTLVIFTSDNGPWWEGSAGELSGRKGGVKDGAYRVPFAARWPAAISPGVVSDAMTMNIDLMPTLAALAGATIPEDHIIDGKNIFSVMNGNEQSPHEKLLFFNQGTLSAIRSERYRFLMEVPYAGYRVQLAKLGKYLLYDLDQGPEHYSVARDNMSIVSDMLLTWRGVHQELENIPQMTSGLPDLSGMFTLDIPSVPPQPIDTNNK